MPKLKNYQPGKRINIWMPAHHLAILKDIDNKSQFFQLAVEQAAGIMALDIIKKEKGLVQPTPTPEQYETWNKDHPLDPLTAKRTQKWPITQNSRQNPAL
jgi:hypothetical protein